jgi:hypothetical protein
MRNAPSTLGWQMLESAFFRIDELAAVTAGTVFTAVPVPLTVCAAALMANAAKQIAHPIFCLCKILPFFCVELQN